MEKTTAYQYPRAILSVDLSGESMCDFVVAKIRPEVVVQGGLTMDYNYRTYEENPNIRIQYMFSTTNKCHFTITHIS